MFWAILGVCAALFLAICANHYITEWHAARLRDCQAYSQDVEARLKSAILQRKKLEFELESKESILYNMEQQLDEPEPVEAPRR